MRVRFAVGAGCMALLAGCCFEPPPSSTNQQPVIAAFSAVTATAPTPLTTAFTWSISDAENDALTCKLDLNNDGTFDKTVAACTSESLRTASFTTVGTSTVTLEVSDGISAPVTATTQVTVGDANPDPFNITLHLDPSVPASASDVFEFAASRWEGFIKTGLPDDNSPYPADYCDRVMDAIPFVDDVYIDVKVGPVDGLGGADASGGSCEERPDGTTIVGVMTLDIDDLDTFLETPRYFEDVMTHEMGHVLGLITGPLVDTTTEPGNPVFTGKAANGIYQELGGNGLIPLRNASNDATGTPAHWGENVFGIEIMTPESGPPEESPLSALSIAALADRGYGVDLANAEAYELPTPAAARAAALDAARSDSIRSH